MRGDSLNQKLVNCNHHCEVTVVIYRTAATFGQLLRNCKAK